MKRCPWCKTEEDASCKEYQQICACLFDADNIEYPKAIGYFLCCHCQLEIHPPVWWLEEGVSDGSKQYDQPACFIRNTRTHNRNAIQKEFQILDFLDELIRKADLKGFL